MSSRNVRRISVRRATWLAGAGALGGGVGGVLGTWLMGRKRHAATAPPPWEQTLQRRIDALALAAGYGLGLYRIRGQLAAVWRARWPPGRRRAAPAHPAS